MTDESKDLEITDDKLEEWQTELCYNCARKVQNTCSEKHGRWCEEHGRGMYEFILRD